MSWLDDLKRSVQSRAAQATRAITQSTPVRIAGRVLGSSFVRPTIGFKPEIAGIIASEFLPKDNPAKKILDAGLYLASGPLNITAGLAGSTPQSDDPYANWQRLGYGSREDMISRIAKQQAVDQALARRPPGTYIADDYGPPRPVKYDDGTVLVGDYRVDRFNPTIAAAETQTRQPQRDTSAPAVQRPAEERRPPVTREVPASPVLQSQEQIRKDIEAEMLVKAANQERTAELMRGMIELGVTGGMTADNMRQWVSKNPALAQNLIKDRLGRKERLAEEFAGFADYAQ